MEDKVKKPNHYTNGNKEVRVAIEDNFSFEETVGYYKGNIMKYVCRYEFKNGLEDIKKAQTYLSFLNGFCACCFAPEGVSHEECKNFRDVLETTKDFLSNKEYITYLKGEVITTLRLFDAERERGSLLTLLFVLLQEMEEVLIEEESKKYTINGGNQSVESCGVLKLWA